MVNKYYAEFETDKVIRENYFSDFSFKGVMVEVGAATPDFISMSKHFRESGWRCICIDPNPQYVKMHLDCGNEIHQYACSFENKDDVDFQVVHFSDDYNNNTITDHSYSSLTIKDTYLKHGQVSINSLPIKNIKVKVRTLNTILSELNIDHVDFLSVDTEGWELEVMKGFDVSKYTPKVILLENWIHTPTYIEYMKSIGYKLNQKLQYNYIFTK